MSLLYARPIGLGEGSKLAPSVPLLQPLSDTKHSGIHELSFQLFEYSILLVTSTPLDILLALLYLHDPHTFMTDLSLSFGVSPRYFPRDLSCLSHLDSMCSHNALLFPVTIYHTMLLSQPVGISH